MKTTRKNKRRTLYYWFFIIILGFIFFLWNVIFMTMKISSIDTTPTTTKTTSTTTTTTTPDNNNNHEEKQVIITPLLLKEDNKGKYYASSFKEEKQQQQQLGSDTATRYYAASNITTTTTTNDPENTTTTSTTMTSFISKKEKSYNTTNATRRRSMIRPSSLQTFDKGGLILFLHIPKTGGSTIRLNIEQKLNSTINYYFVSGKGLYEYYIPVITKYVSYGIQQKRYWRKPIMIEIHGRDSPSLLQLHNKLLNLRRLAKLNGIPIFFFTIIRKPIQYQISYFNFFHVHYNKYNKNPTKYFPQVKKASQENLLKYSLYNPQCQFLSRGEFSLRRKEKQIVTQQECDQVYNVLCETMDWVGTTERLDIEILPLLKHILLFNNNNLSSSSSSNNFQFDKHLVVGPSSEFDDNKNKNNNGNGNNSSRNNNNVIKNKKESISYQQLNLSTISILKSMNQLDFELYDKLQKQFPFTTTTTSAQ